MKDLITFWNIDINLLFILALIGVLKKKSQICCYWWSFIDLFVSANRNEQVIFCISSNKFGCFDYKRWKSSCWHGCCLCGVVLVDEWYVGMWWFLWTSSFHVAFCLLCCVLSIMLTSHYWITALEEAILTKMLQMLERKYCSILGKMMDLEEHLS